MFRQLTPPHGALRQVPSSTEEGSVYEIFEFRDGNWSSPVSVAKPVLVDAFHEGIEVERALGRALIKRARSARFTFASFAAETKLG